MNGKPKEKAAAVSQHHRKKKVYRKVKKPWQPNEDTEFETCTDDGEEEDSTPTKKLRAKPTANTNGFTPRSSRTHPVVEIPTFNPSKPDFLNTTNSDTFGSTKGIKTAYPTKNDASRGTRAGAGRMFGASRNGTEPHTPVKPKAKPLRFLHHRLEQR